MLRQQSKKEKGKGKEKEKGRNKERKLWKGKEILAIATHID